MCTPQSLTSLQAITSIGQSLIKPQSSSQSSKTTQAQADAYRRNAEEERRQGRLESNRNKVETAGLLSQQKNALAAAGVETDIGSAVDILNDTEQEQEHDRKESLRSSNLRADNQDLLADGKLESLASASETDGYDAFEKGSTLLTRTFSGFNKRGILRY